MPATETFVMYRPTVPAARAQSVQVVNAAHALAALGHPVELWANGRGSAEDALAAYGLAPIPELRLRLVGGLGRTAASIAYRAGFAAWVARTRRQGVVIARDKRHAAWALAVFGWDLRLVLEVHEVADHEFADPSRRERLRAIEARAIRGARGIVANAPGTLALLRDSHPVLPPAVVIHNAAAPRTVEPHGGPDAPVGVVGSVRPYKDPLTVARAAALTRPRTRVRWIGADVGADEARALTDASAGRLELWPPVAHRDVPGLLAGFRTLILPLSAGVFGERLTSPLKLWDALASGVPLVAADTGAIRAAADGAFVPYTPGDPRSLADAVDRASSDDGLRDAVTTRAAALARTWSMRAREVDAFVRGVTAG